MMRDRRFGDYCGHFRSNQHPDHLLGDRPHSLAGSAPAHRSAHPPDLADRDHRDRYHLAAEVLGHFLTDRWRELRHLRSDRDARNDRHARGLG